jgi:hypothetical protein
MAAHFANERYGFSLLQIHPKVLEIHILLLLQAFLDYGDCSSSTYIRQKTD